MPGNSRSHELIRAEEDFVIDAQFLLHELMEKKGISRKQLAEQAGISVARLSQLFRAEANPTAKTIARLFEALGERAEITVKGKESVASSDQNGGDWELGLPSPSFEPLSKSKRNQMINFARLFSGGLASNDNPSGNVRVWKSDDEIQSLEAA
jgi:transcriptional regulator with XRE-family HTH domain